MMYDLPISVTVGGVEYKIRSDYRAALDICAALSDVDLNEQDKAITILCIFYPDVDDMPPADYQEAIEKCFWFIGCGEDNENQKAPKLMDWEQDFKYIVAPINRVCGTEIRALEYLHWWTFVSAYYEIGGDCTFAEIVRIREKLQSHKPLDKSEKEWYRKNKSMVDFKTNYSEQENELLKQWIL